MQARWIILLQQARQGVQFAGRPVALALFLAQAAAPALRVARGLILNWTLHRDTVVRLAPPLTIGDADSERALTAIAGALDDIG